MRASAVLVLTVLAAGIARADDPWLPLADGKRWTYAVKVTSRAAIASSTKEGTATATCGAGDNGVFPLAWRMEDGESRTAWVSSDAAGVTVVRASGDKLPLLPFNRTDAGPVTGSQVTVGGRALAMESLAVKGVEKVTTPHGQHEALRVESTQSAPAAKVRTTVWYARGVGPVKIVQVSEAPATKVERELLLKEVTTGAATTPPAAPQGGGATPPPAASPGGGLAALVREAKGASADLTKLKALAAEVLRRSEAAGKKKLAARAWAWATENAALRPTVGGQLQQMGGIDGAVLVIDGNIQLMGGLKNSVVFCTGEVDVAGGIDGSLVLSLGDIDTAGGLVDVVAASVNGEVDVAGAIQRAVLQGKEVDNAGGRTDATVVAPGATDLVTPLR